MEVDKRPGFGDLQVADFLHTLYDTPCVAVKKATQAVDKRRRQAPVFVVSDAQLDSCKVTLSGDHRLFEMFTLPHGLEEGLQKWHIAAMRDVLWIKTAPGELGEYFELTRDGVEGLWEVTYHERTADDEIHDPHYGHSWDIFQDKLPKLQGNARIWLLG